MDIISDLDVSVNATTLCYMSHSVALAAIVDIKLTKGAD